MFMYKYLQHYVSHFRNPFCSPLFSLLKSKTHCTLNALHWNPLPYIGKFDGQATFGIYGLAATYGHNNITQALQYSCFEHKYNTHNIQCGYCCSTANLWLQPIYGYDHSAVTANLWLRTIYGYGHSILLLRPLCPLQLQFCYI